MQMAKACPLYQSCYRAFVTTLVIWWCCWNPIWVTATRYMPVGLISDKVHVITFNESIVGDYFINSLGMNLDSVGVCDNPWNSCVGRCADTPVPGFYTCFCDAICKRYGDCCLDYERECSVNDEDPIAESRPRPDKSYLACIRPDEESRSTFGVLMVDRCPSIMRGENTTKDLCEDEEEGETWPVTSPVGDVFRNVHCATCHHIREYSSWHKRTSCESMESCYMAFVPPRYLPTPRPCLYHVGRCEDPNTPAALSEACGSYSGSVFLLSGNIRKEDPRGDKQTVNSTEYKNFHCAQCNGVQVESLKCPAWYLSATYINHDHNSRITTSSLQPSIATDLSDSSTMIVKLVLFVEPVRSSNLPAAFSVLFNFNLDGENVMFNSQNSAWWEATQENCQPEQLWDPFLSQCRPLMCGSEYVLVDYQCVENSNSSKLNSTLTANSDTANSVLMMDTTSVLITLNLDINAFGDNNMDSVSEALQDELLEMLARSLDLSSKRFTNYTLVELIQDTQWGSVSSRINAIPEATTFTEMMGTVSFVFSGCENRTEPTIPMVTSTLSAGISSNKILLYIGSNNSIIVRAIGIQETAAQQTDNSLNWCTKGLVREYVNEPFEITYTMLEGGDVRITLEMNSTGQVYSQGEFLISAMYQGSPDSSVTNGSTYILACELLPKPNCSSGMYLGLNPWEFTILDNGSLVYNGNATYLHATYDPEEYQCNYGNISVCIHPEDIIIEPEDPHGYDWDSTYPLRIMGTVLLGLSVAGIFVTIVSYCLFNQLRNLPGANMINLALCIMAFQITFLAGMRESVDNAACLYVAISLHYEVLALFCWANVMAIDMYSTFGTRKIQASARKKGKYLPRYMGYAYGLPALIVSICCIFNFCQCVDGVVIGYAKSNICWITEGKALAYAFALPLGIILAVNFLLFGLTVRRMRRNKKERQKQKLDVINCKKTHRREDVKIYARMSSVMCFTWIFGFVMAIEGNPPWLAKTFQTLFVLTNTIQGLVICLAFVCNSRVLDLYRQLFQRCCKTVRVREPSGITHDTATPGLRTLSTETFMSTVSMGSSQDGQ